MEIMMHFMGKELNFAYFLSHSLKHLVERVKASKYGIPIHQVLINLIYNRVLDSIPHQDIVNHHGSIESGHHEGEIQNQAWSHGLNSYQAVKIVFLIHSLDSGYQVNYDSNLDFFFALPIRFKAKCNTIVDSSIFTFLHRSLILGLENWYLGSFLYLILWKMSYIVFFLIVLYYSVMGLS